MKKSQLKGVIKEIIKSVVKEMAPGANGGGINEPEDSNGNYLASGISHGSAHPAGAELFDATIMFAGTSLMINTRKGHVELQLTPEQVQLLKSELNNLKEMTTTSGVEGYQTPYAFSGKGRRSSKKALEASKGLGF